MRRVYVVVEGQTEESFVGNVLAPTLWPHQISLTPILLGVPGHKGGRTNYPRVRRDVLTMLKQDAGSYCTTMLDLYGLGDGFPGMPAPQKFCTQDKIRHIESAFRQDICNRIPNVRPDVRFIPYLQLHEYEALLFSDPPAFARGINQAHLEKKLQQVRDEFDSPEDINDSPSTAPSKRVFAIYPQYRKVIEGTQAAKSIGIATILEQCRHFREWVEALQSLGDIEA